MKTEILNLLNQLEAEKNIEILYACESGSRAWGFPSPDSDYDFRFIYRHPKDWYLGVNEKADSIQVMPNKLLDGSGWDIRKVLRLLYKSNSSIFEWLNSPIVYQKKEDFVLEFRELLDRYFLPKSMMHHYLGIANGMLAKEFQTSEVKIKKYFYVLRPVLAAKWVGEKRTAPPVLFEELLPLVDNQEVIAEVKSLLLRKEKAAEGEIIERIPLLDAFVKKEMEHCETIAIALPKKQNNYELINQFYRKMLEV